MLVDELRFLSDLDADLHLVLPAGLPGDGWTVTVVKVGGARVEALRDGPGHFSYYGPQERWWWVEIGDVAHVEVAAPDGTTATLHSDRLGGPPGSCPACTAAAG